MVGLLFIAMISIFCHLFWELFLMRDDGSQTLFNHRLEEPKTVSQWPQKDDL